MKPIHLNVLHPNLATDSGLSLIKCLSGIEDSHIFYATTLINFFRPANCLCNSYELAFFTFTYEKGNPLTVTFHPGMQKLAVTIGLIIITATACSSQAVTGLSTVRVIIEFHKPVDGANGELLSRLSLRSGATLRYATSVSATQYAYELTCPSKDPGCQSAIDNLRSDLAIASISADQLRGHQ